MIIAVNTKVLSDNFPEEYGSFTYEIAKCIAANNPEHTFIFFIDRQYDQHLIPALNIKKVIAGSVAVHPLLRKFWYDIKIPVLLKKYKADIFVCCDAMCSLTTKVPQCLLIYDLGILQYPAFIKKSHLFFYKKYLLKFLNKAKSIVVPTRFVKQDIISRYKMEASKIDVVYTAANEVFQPINDDEKKIIKNKYTEGLEYFVYAGEIHPRKNLLNLLKAFSVFKKRQQTNMKLVLTGKLSKQYKSFSEDLKSYKYRKDIVLTGAVDETELVKIIGAAYGLIYPSLNEGFCVSVLQAMNSGVPVIAHSSMQEIAKNAALYADATTHIDIADKMMLLYKDENMRKMLIEKGKNIANLYSWEKTAILLWQSILKATK